MQVTPDDGVLPALPPELLHRVLGLLPPNELACTARLVCKAAAAAFCSPQYTTVRLSLPSPHDAFVRRWGEPLAMRPLTLERRRQLLFLTGASGDIVNLQFIALHVGCLVGTAAAPPAGTAAAGPALDEAWWLRREGNARVVYKVLAAAAEAGRRPMVEWIVANARFEGARPRGSRYSHTKWLLYQASCCAARGGHKSLMVWLHEERKVVNKFNDPYYLLIAAAAGYDLRMLQRLHRTHLPGRKAGEHIITAEQHRPDVVGAAAASATSDWRAKVEWLEGQGYPRTDGAAAFAARYPDAPARLAWLGARGYPLTARVVRAAAGSGNVEALQYLLAEGTPSDGPAMDAATWYCNLQAMQMLHAQGRPIAADALCYAARAGSLPAVCWLLGLLGNEQQRAALDADLISAAAESGCLALLVRLRELGCPLTAKTFARAASAGSEEVLEWLAEQGCPMEVDGDDIGIDDPYLMATDHRDIHTMACLRRLGCPWLPLDRQARQMTDLQASAPAPEAPPALASAPWHHLPPELLLRALACLPPNELACTARLVCKATAAALSSQQHTTVRLSQPSPCGEFVRRWGGPGAMRPLTLVRRRLLLSLTAASGCLENLQWLAAHVGCSLTREAFEAAAAAGRLEVCRWLQQQGCDGHGWALSAAKAAAGAGQRATVEWLLANARDSGRTDLKGAACHASLACSAARGGHQQSCYMQWWALSGAEAAASAGQRAVVEWLLACARDSGHKEDDLGSVEDRTSLACSAARGGHVCTMDWLLQRRGLERDGDAAATVLVAAAEGCDLPTLQRLYHAYPQAAAGGWPDQILTSAAGSPTPDWKAKVEWLEGLGAAASSSPEACAKAASRPDALDRLSWLRGRGYPWDWRATEAVAVAGNLDALRYLLAKGCPVQESTGWAVAEAGQLASLQALHAHSNTFTRWKSALAGAGRGGHLPVVAWLLEQQLVSLLQCPSLLCKAANSGSVELLAWLRDRGCPWGDDSFHCAVGAGSEEALDWLVAQGCPMPESRVPDDDLYLKPACNEDWNTLACLRRLGCPWLPLNRENGTFLNAVWGCCSVPALRRLLELGCPVDWRRAIEEAEHGNEGGCSMPALRRLMELGCPVDWLLATGVATLDGMTYLQASASAPEAAPATDAANPWQHLPPELLLRVLACLPPNERACTARLVCKTVAAALSSPQHTTVRLSQPSPCGEFVRRWGGPGAMRPLTLVRRRLLLSLTAASSCLDNLQWLAAHVGCSLSGEEIQAAAAAAGHLDVCRWLQQQSCDEEEWVLGGATAAAGAGQRAVVEWLLANPGKQGGTGLNGAACRTSLACYAARGGYVGLMDWLLQRHGLERDGDAAAALLVAAAEGCDLPTLQRLYHTYPPKAAAGGGPARLGPVLRSAAGSPTPDWRAKVEWLEGQGAAASSSQDACARAASRPDALDRLTWLRGRGYPWNWQATNSAAVAGNLDALRYLLAEGCPVEGSTLGAAAGAGQLAALQALHAHSSTFTRWKSALARAVGGGHLPVVVWLLEQHLVRLRQRPSLLRKAAELGSVELLAWLRDRGCAWTEDTFYCAAVSGSEDALEWLVAQGCPVTEPRGRDDDPHLTAALQEDWSTMACLRRLSCPWYGGTFANAVQEQCSVPALRRLLELGCPVDSGWWHAIRPSWRMRAPPRGDKDVFAWLEEEQRRRHGEGGPQQQ
ncbi:hypothetical protein TSOC_005743 [Tetrabaena socialis]|uniref:F-box domain-containing protein n=1 Tax=Tetrabaena socialis TaxID=47790 RepID=A0A2J8A5G4_9CHLO|nr:hypothetical protein TSOC_005743 [Tetrabaena socialis]|eukprot:PNH07772.1 hypothetical protein TSOC_005743 [Tetrabaena socialis]